MMLTNNQKERVLANLQKGRFASQTLTERIKGETLDEDFKNQLLSVMESYLTDVHKEMDFESHLVEENEKRYETLRRAHKRIEELEEQLSTKNPIAGFKEQFNLIKDTLHQWWRADGFVYVPDVRVIYYGTIEVKFGFQLSRRVSMFSKDPEGDREDAKRHFLQLKESGFEFAEQLTESLYHKDLLSTENNRSLLTDLITKRFPSAEIVEFETSAVDGVFMIQHVNVHIKEAVDIINSNY